MHSRRTKVYKALKYFFERNKPVAIEKSEPPSPPSDNNDEQWAERDTLVGVLRNVAQLKIALENKFYHIPVKYISEHDLPLKYIAIYQSKNLFGNDSGIHYYGEIVSCRCVKRNCIHEIPKDSNEYYYRFEIREWKSLKYPIEAKELGFIRILTNFEMMENSTEIPQLLLKNRELHKMYTDIKNSILTLQQNPEMEPPILHFGDYSIIVELDDLILFKNTKPVNSFSVYDFLDLPNTIMTQIYKHMKK